MSTVADKLAKKSSHKTSAKQVRLRLVYIDFWSAVKLSFLAAIAIAVLTVAAFVMVFLVVRDRADRPGGRVHRQLLGRQLPALTVRELPQVLAFSAIVAILNLVVVTVMGAVIAGIYNLAVKVTGGLLVGFTSN